MEDIKEKEWVARYSGERIDLAENARRKGRHYRIQISKNLFLDAEDARHFEGRFINDGKRAGLVPNVRFAAGYRTNTCTTTGFSWIRIFATRDIKAGEELLLDYGSDFWDDITSMSTPATTTASSTTLSAPASATRPKKTLLDYWKRTAPTTTTKTHDTPPHATPVSNKQHAVPPSSTPTRHTSLASISTPPSTQWAATAFIPETPPSTNSPWAASAYIPETPPSPTTLNSCDHATPWHSSINNHIYHPNHIWAPQPPSPTILPTLSLSNHPTTYITNPQCP